LKSFTYARPFFTTTPQVIGALATKALGSEGPSSVISRPCRHHQRGGALADSGHGVLWAGVGRQS
jgi:hypothetical protein